MAAAHANLLQGTLDLLILKSLTLGERHGLAIAERIEQVTRGTFLVKPGSLGKPIPGGEVFREKRCLAFPCRLRAFSRCSNCLV